jgi:zinc transport system substrate-binding protein
MKAYRRFLITTIIIFMLLLGACKATAPAQSSQKLLTVSILPQQYFVERIAGELFKVNVMVQPGQSPENYEPTPQQMRDVGQSLAYITIGAPFENTWIEKLKAANPNLRIFDSTEGIERLPMIQHEHASDQTNPAQSGSGELDPHIWTSPRLVKIQAQQITKLLIELDPENEMSFTQNLNNFLEDIDKLDKELSTILASAPNRKFMVYHPTWGYFADDYNLEQLAIEIEGTEPSAQELAAIIDEAKADNVRVIFIQPEFNGRSAETISREIGGKVIQVSSLEKNWLENLRSVGKIFAESLIQ